MTTQITSENYIPGSLSNLGGAPDNKELEGNIASGKLPQDPELSTRKATKVEQVKEEDANIKGEQSPLSELELDKAMETISEFMNMSTRNVNFQKDDSSEKTVIKVFDAKSKELIKQFPSEEVLDIAEKIIALRQDVGAKTGILLDEKV